MAVKSAERKAPAVKRAKIARPLAPERVAAERVAAERVAAILKALRKAYPDVVCALQHRNAWELTVATILSAQCTDVRVNIVTPELFKRFPTPKAMVTG